MNENQKVLLLVENEALILISLQVSLNNAGFHVLTAAHGMAAIEQLNSADNNISGLITDVDLSNGDNGWDIARHARESNHSLPVVYMTGDGQDWASQGVPNSLVVRKPFADIQIITAISTLLNNASEQS